MNSQMYNYVLARAKALDDKEVVGYITTAGGYNPRESFDEIYIPEKRKSVLVDPMTVEIYTGMRDATDPEKRIFEGDVVQLFSMNGTTIASNIRGFEEDDLCEICMPLIFTKNGASKRLYLHHQDGFDSPGETDGFYEVCSQWDALEYCIVGRVDDASFETGYFTPAKIEIDPVLEGDPLADPMKESRVWDVTVSADPRMDKVCKFFGSMKRRQHIIRRMFDHDYYLGLVRREPEFEKLVPKWKDEYERYYKIWQ